MAIEKSEVKELAKAAIKNVGEVVYPDLLMYLAQQLIHPHLEEVVQGLEKKGLITVTESKIGAVITKVAKKG